MICDKSYASVPFTWWSTLKRTWARYLNWAKPVDENKPEDSTFHSIRGWLQKDISHISLEKKTQLNMKVCDKISPTAARGTPSHIRQCARLPVEMWVPSFQISISGFESFHVGLYLLLELAYRKPQRFFSFWDAWLRLPDWWRAWSLCLGPLPLQATTGLNMDLMRISLCKCSFNCHLCRVLGLALAICRQRLLSIISVWFHTVVMVTLPTTGGHNSHFLLIIILFLLLLILSILFLEISSSLCHKGQRYP